MQARQVLKPAIYGLRLVQAEIPLQRLQMGLYGPVGLPANVVTRLNTELNKVLRSEDLRKKYAVDGIEAASGTPADLAVYLKTDFDRWAKVVKAAGIKPE